MQILVLLGPNLNLLGTITRATGQRLTMDKLVTALRKAAKSADAELVIFQRQSESASSRLVQQRRKSVGGILVIPGVWAQTGQLLSETLHITGLPVGIFHLVPEGGPWSERENSVFSGSVLLEESGRGLEEAGVFLLNLLNQIRS